MKNLFKNLMLVAVAAMAFTACTEENNEVNAVAKKTVVNGVAIIDADDTRSGFVGSETTENGDGTTTTKYKSAWDGGETIKLFAQGGLETTATIDAEGEGKFSAVFEGELPESFYMTVCSPAEAWSNASSYTIPAEQTPRENSVDPAAHILQKQNVSVANGTADYVSMEHQVAYGKMTVNTPAEFVIDHVDIELNGVWYGSAKNLSYTINADNVVNNTFWFATDVINVADFTVTAYDVEGEAYTKSVTIGDKALNFNYGRVSTFSVSNLEAYEEPAVSSVYTSAKLVQEYSYNDKMVAFYGDGLEDLEINFYGVAMLDGKLNVGTFNIGYGLYDGYCFYGDTQLKTITVKSTFEAGMYKLVFSNLTDNNGNVVVDRELTFQGLISGLEPIDLRTPLDTPNVSSSVVGKTITISWDPVDNVDGYRVKLYSPYDEYFEEVVTDTEYVYVAEQWSTMYSFTIMSYASNENATYKSSEDAYVDIKTEKDPNAVLTADYTATSISWNDSEQRFEFIADNLQYFYVKMNADDRPGNNSFAVGEYTGVGSRNVSVKQFAVMQKVINGYSIGWADTANTSTMSIEVKDGEYVIYISYVAAYNQGAYTLMYKGLPNGFVLPGEDGDDNTGEGGDTSGEPDGSLNNPYTFTKCDVFVAQYPKITFSGAEDGATLTLESNTSYGLPTGVVTLGNNGWWSSGHSYSLGDIDPGYSYSSIDQNSNGSYTINYIMIKSGSKTIYYHYSGGSIL